MYLRKNIHKQPNNTTQKSLQEKGTTRVRPINIMPKIKNKFGETKIDNEVCVITFKPTNTNIDKILQVTKRQGFTLLDLQTKDANLEDVFISLTKN